MKKNMTKLHKPLTYSIQNGEPIIEGYTMEKPDRKQYFGRYQQMLKDDYKKWQQSKEAVKVDKSIFDYLYINTHLWKWNDDLTIINIDFLADRIEVRDNTAFLLPILSDTTIMLNKLDSLKERKDIENAYNKQFGIEQSFTIEQIEKAFDKYLQSKVNNKTQAKDVFIEILKSNN